MNRRDFLKRMGGAVAAITLSPLLDLCPVEQTGGLQCLIGHTPTTATVGGINRATFQFWRSHPSQLLFLSQEGPMVMWGGGHASYLSDGHIPDLRKLFEK